MCLKSDHFSWCFASSVSALFRWHRHLIVPSAHTSQSKCVVLVNSPFSPLAPSSALVQELVLNWAAHWLLPAVKIFSVLQGSDGDGLALLHQSNPQYSPLMRGATNTKHSEEISLENIFGIALSQRFQVLILLGNECILHIIQCGATKVECKTSWVAVF